MSDACEPFVRLYGPDAVPAMAHLLGEETELLRRIAAALERPAPEVTATPLLDRQATAAMFGISIKTLTRLVKPTSQPRKGGRSWYDPADVERQLRVLGPMPSSKSVGASHHAPKRARKRTAPNVAPSRSNDERIDTIEQRLLNPRARGRST